MILADIIQPINWPFTDGPKSCRQQPPKGAMVNWDGHEVFANGHLRAVPNCGCEYCEAVFDDWGSQMIGYEAWRELKKKAKKKK